MATYIKAKLNKSDNQTDIDKYRVAANITEYHFISKLILLKFMLERHLFHVKNQHV